MDKAISVLVLTTSFPVKGLSDAGHFVEDDCIALFNSGHRVTVLAPSPQKKSHSNNEQYSLRYFNYFFPIKMQRLAYGSGMPINLKKSFLARIQFPIFFISFLISALRLSKEADLIHCHWFPAGFIGAIVKALTGKKLVLTMHHTHVSNLIYNWVLKKCDYLFCNSTYTLKITNQIYEVEKSSIMPLRIDTDVFKPSPQGLYLTSFRILFVGRLIEIKGADLLIRAFKVFIEETGDKKSQLEIVGEGPMKNELIELTKGFDLLDQVHFKGQIDRQYLPSIYQNSSVFVIPSVELKGGEAEGLGLTAMEASSCGLPVIGADTGGIPDHIIHGENGLLFESGNESALVEMITKLHSDKELSKKLGEEGRSRALVKYTHEAIRESLISAYKDVI